MGGGEMCILNHEASVFNTSTSPFNFTTSLTVIIYHVCHGPELHCSVLRPPLSDIVVQLGLIQSAAMEAAQ